MKVNVPTVVGFPVTYPDETPWVKGPLMPGGMTPLTTLHWTVWVDVRQPVVVQKKVWRSPTWYVAGDVGVIVHEPCCGAVVVVVGGSVVVVVDGGAEGVQPDSVTDVEPVGSVTVARQLLATNPLASTR